MKLKASAGELGGPTGDNMMARLLVASVRQLMASNK